MAVCHDNGILVPDDIAVLGCENDTLLCEGILPELSSIRLPYIKMGFEAARHLDRSIRNRPVAGIRELMLPTGVEVRASSSRLVLKDEAIRTAVQYIRRHAASKPSIQEIADGCGLSLRQLQRRFKNAVGHTAVHEIQLARIEVVKSLLNSTDMTLASIAKKAGYKNEYYLGKNFKKMTGSTPSSYRQKYLLR